MNAELIAATRAQHGDPGAMSDADVSGTCAVCWEQMPCTPRLLADELDRCGALVADLQTEAATDWRAVHDTSRASALVRADLALRLLERHGFEVVS